MTGRTLDRVEEMVARALGRHLGVSWRPGDDPPDIYLCFDNEDISVEITALVQLISDERGTRPRHSDDMYAVNAVKRLNRDFGEVVAPGTSISLYLTLPLTKPAQTFTHLKKELQLLIRTHGPADLEIAFVVHGNTIKVIQHTHGHLGADKISGIFPHRHSSPDITANCIRSLEDRIQTKAAKCRKVAQRGRIWLALLNDYVPAENDSFVYAYKQVRIQHPFEKIFLISSSGEVDQL
jgi:hypothetical protein